MKRANYVIFTFLVAVLALSRSAQAQGSPIIIGPTATLNWDLQGAPDAATALTWSYLATVDATTPKALTGVTCAIPIAPLVVCKAPLSQIPTGSHSIILQTQVGTLVSTASNPLAYIDLLIPIPTNARIIGD